MVIALGPGVDMLLVSTINSLARSGLVHLLRYRRDPVSGLNNVVSSVDKTFSSFICTGPCSPGVFVECALAIPHVSSIFLAYVSCDKIMVPAFTFRCIPIPKRNYSSPRSTVSNPSFSFSITFNTSSLSEPDSKMSSTSRSQTAPSPKL